MGLGVAHKKAGFTLVELLVVLVILGLMTGVVMLSWPDGDKGLKEEASRLAARLDAAARQAVITGRPYGFVAEPGGYRFFQRQGGEWRAPFGEPAFAPRTFSEGFLLFVERTDDIPAQEGEADEPSAFGLGEETPRPDIHFHPIGVVTPFRITLEGETALYAITGDEAGVIRLERADG